MRNFLWIEWNEMKKKFRLVISSAYAYIPLQGPIFRLSMRITIFLVQQKRLQRFSWNFAYPPNFTWKIFWWRHHFQNFGLWRHRGGSKGPKMTIFQKIRSDLDETWKNGQKHVCDKLFKIFKFFWPPMTS